MPGKEQERFALEQIRQIVAALGEDSYIATAFEGCFDIAEENINNDFACSMKKRAEAAERRASGYEAEVNHLEKELKGAREHAAGVEENLRKTEAYYEKRLAEGEEWNDRFRIEQSNHDHTKNELAKASEMLAARDAEIIKLKAKLYDLMCPA